MDENVYSTGGLRERRGLGGIAEAVNKTYASKVLGQLAKPIKYVAKRIADYAVKKFNKNFYIHEVLGQHGKTIYALKIRTMYNGANGALKERLERNGFDDLGKPNDDEYMISERRWMRECFIDEIPQIFYNILYKQNMRWVGERPQPADIWAKQIKDGIVTKEEMEEVLQELPGLCGVQYRHPELDSITARRKYRAFKKSKPGSADLDYFIRIWENIFLRGLRSR